MRARNVRVVLQLRAVHAAQREQRGQVERAGQDGDLIIRDVELVLKELERLVVHVFGHFQADGGTKASTQQFFFERLQQVLGLVLFNGDVFVTSDPERMVVNDLHAGEEHFQVLGNEIFEQDEPVLALGRLQWIQARQHRRHLEACEVGLGAFRVAHSHREVQRKARDIGEWMRRVDSQWHQDGEDIVRENFG